MSAEDIWSLISNAALLLALGVLYDVVLQQSSRLLPLKNFLIGAVIGTIGITIMSHPWALAPGLFFDTRTILLSVTSLFFGVVPAVVAAFVTILFRVFQGGVGVAPGVASITSAVLIGLAWRHFRPQWQKTFGGIELYLFGCVVHVVMLMCMLFLPWPMASRTLTQIALPVLLIYPLGTVLLGMLLERQLSHREAESLLQSSERRFRKMIEKSGDMIVLINAQGRIVYVSESIQRILGYPIEEVLGRAATENVHPVDVTLWLDVLSSLRNTASGSRSVRIRVRHRDGRWLWLDINLTNLLNDPTVEALVVNARELGGRHPADADFEQRAAEMASLCRASRTVNARMSLEKVGRLAVAAVDEVLNPDRVLLFLCRDESLVLAAREPEQRSWPADIAAGSGPGDCLCRLAADSGSPVYALDIRRDSRCGRSECTGSGVVSVAAVPLRSGGRMLGVCCVASTRERDFRQQVHLIDLLADLLALGVRNAQLNEELQQHAAALEPPLEAFRGPDAGAGGMSMREQEPEIGGDGQFQGDVLGESRDERSNR